jgi:tetratricopeptide (TPR) repeat protein
MEEYKTTISLSPDDANSYFNLGCLYSKIGKNDEALKYLHRSVELNPEDEFAHFNIAYELQNMRRFDEALKGYSNVIRLNPGYSWAYFNMGYIYMELGEVKKAYEQFKKTFELNPKDYKALKNLIDIAVKIKCFPEVQDLLENVVVVDPENPYINYYLAEIYFIQKNHEDSLFHYRKVLKQENNADLEINFVKIKKRIESLTTKNN